MNATNQPASGRDLEITRYIAARPAEVFRAWTDPELLKQWFCPRPWYVASADLDVRPGGSASILMRGPEGEENPTQGVYLEVVENERLVLTDAYTDAWTPSAKPFMTAIVTFEPESEGTRYTARVRHWTTADRDEHEKMGFHEGWGKATDQLEELLGAGPG